MQHKLPSYIQDIPELAPLLKDADHIDVKTATGTMSMRQFLASMLSYQPGWVTFLFGVRAVFVRFLGMHQRGLPRATSMKPEDIPMKPGSNARFFKICMAAEEHYWVAETDDSHLKAALGVVVEPLSNQQRRFHVLTVVHYHNWAGSVYFNIIRPFHHLVVGRMVKAGTM